MDGSLPASQFCLLQRDHRFALDAGLPHQPEVVTCKLPAALVVPPACATAAAGDPQQPGMIQQHQQGVVARLLASRLTQACAVVTTDMLPVG
jgi:hypothetical protein